MLQAQQSVLLQNTNQAVLAIRQAEISFYTSFFTSFGAQAAIMGGFTYSALTQISFQAYDVEYTFGTKMFLQDVFWITSAVCMAASLHCIFTTILLQVMGPGLALSGPTGFYLYIFLFMYLFIYLFIYHTDILISIYLSIYLFGPTGSVAKAANGMQQVSMNLSIYLSLSFSLSL
jgi:hypothetical protein